MRRTVDTFSRRAIGLLSAVGLATVTIGIGTATPVAAGVAAGSTTCFTSSVPAGAGLVVNGTAAQPTERGFLNFFAPAFGAEPDANSSVNFEVGPAIANSVVVPVPADGRTCVFNSAEVEVIADVSGYVSPDSLLTFEDGAANRVLDSRDVRKFEPGETFCFAPASNAEVGQPTIANLTIAGAEAAGFANLYPKGATPDATSVINFVPGRNIANGVTVTVGTDGEICAFSSTRAHVIVDIIGAVDTADYRPARTDNSAVREVDTRTTSPLAAGEVRCFSTAAGAGEAVVLNATAVRSAGTGFLNVFSKGSAADPASNSSVNFRSGANFANGIIVLAGTDAEICVFASERTDVLIDISGYLSAGTFVPLNSDGSADRVLDTR